MNISYTTKVQLRLPSDEAFYPDKYPNATQESIRFGTLLEVIGDLQDYVPDRAKVTRVNGYLFIEWETTIDETPTQLPWQTENED